MVPQLKLQNGKPIIEGNFEFSLGQPMYNPTTFMPTVDITFKWCPEITMETQLAIEKNQYVELVAEKLKQDFIDYIKTLNV
jgi:hypothetical protein